MSNARCLIVNADDFGLSDGVNRGVLDTHELGIVTSASLMVCGSAADGAAAIANEHPELSVGLHLDLGEWRYSGGRWNAVYERAPLDDPKLIESEVAAQCEKFAKLLGTAPTHLDSHQHAHRNEPLRSIVIAKGSELGIPVRHFTPRVRYCGDFYGQNEQGESFPERLTPSFLSRVVRSFGDGVAELCCHPAAAVDFNSAYSSERMSEMRTLCHPSVRAAVEDAGIALISFSSLRAASA